MTRKPIPSVFAPEIVSPAIGDAFKKLNPRWLARNPVIFMTAVTALMATIYFVRDLAQAGDALFSDQITLWLWLTALFANFAEAVAEGRGKAQAASLRKTQTATTAKRLASLDATDFTAIAAPELKIGDFVVCEPGVIPGDGEAIEEILSYARDQNVTHIVVGAASRPLWIELLRGSMIRRLARGAGDIAIEITPREEKKTSAAVV